MEQIKDLNIFLYSIMVAADPVPLKYYGPPGAETMAANHA
jgi:hypothetical protein|tara:strand:- start:209 stop:328 length:120 start_codon:yes stop_codon:yes gene_type:complete